MKHLKREGLMNPDIVASLEQARLFARRNTVKADSAKSVCGDGRFTSEQSRGYIRMFGGDEGLLMAIVGALNTHQPPIKIPYEELVARFGAALRFLPERGENAVIGTHSDKHAEHEGRIGCGHVANAINRNVNHDKISAEEVEDLHKQVTSGKHEKVVIDGKHAEKAVLLVYGMHWTVNSFDAKLGQMYFVVDMDRAKDLIKKVVPGLGIHGLTTEAVWQQFESQMLATASFLAGGKNIFRVLFDAKGYPSVKYVHKVPFPRKS
jgi:hypothetical protein